MEIRKDGLYIDGKPFRLFSGAMHYFRIPRAYWGDRFAKMKAAGFNCVETVLCWNLHEPKEGEFCFAGNLDIADFCRTAAEYGLYIVIRPGPYTCAEWDFGGFPAWLLSDHNIRFRCDEPVYMQKVESYFKRVFQEIAPLQDTRGGNLIALQIENEYGSYGDDKEYLEHLRQIMTRCGAEVPFFTSDGNNCNMLSGGTLPDVYKTLNFGSHAKTAFDSLKGFQEGLPKTCMEFWCGWFDHWGERHHRRNPGQVAREIRNLVDTGANLNIYMFHGGTNFNFWAGANYGNKYQPTVTSYDDAALLNEYGDYTPAYHKVREILRTARQLPMDEALPPRPQLQKVGTIRLTECAPLWETCYQIGERHYSAHPESMERFGQNFGYILYRKVLKGNYSAQTLCVEGVHDIAYLRVNGELVYRYDRTKNGRMKNNDGFTCKIPAFNGECVIEILVEGMGRVNYGPHLADRKGIARVRHGMQVVFGWEIYTLPMDNLDQVSFQSGSLNGAPGFLKGTFSARTDADCFVDMRGFTKGCVFVNGIHIGRYWNRGPQRTLYLPAPFLKEENEIIILEQEKTRLQSVNIIDRHLL